MVSESLSLRPTFPSSFQKESVSILKAGFGHFHCDKGKCVSGGAHGLEYHGAKQKLTESSLDIYIYIFLNLPG